MHDQWAGDDDRLAAAFDDVSRGRPDRRARDPAPPMRRQTDQARVQVPTGAAVDGASDVGVDLDVDAWVLGLGAERLRGLGTDAIRLEIGDGDGDGVDRGVEPLPRVRGPWAVRRRRRGAVKWNEDAVVGGVRGSMR